MDKERNAKEIGGESNIAAAFMIVLGHIFYKPSKVERRIFSYFFGTRNYYLLFLYALSVDLFGFGTNAISVTKLTSSKIPYYLN